MGLDELFSKFESYGYGPDEIEDALVEFFDTAEY